MDSLDGVWAREPHANSVSADGVSLYADLSAEFGVCQSYCFPDLKEPFNGADHVERHAPAWNKLYELLSHVWIQSPPQKNPNPSDAVVLQ